MSGYLVALACALAPVAVVGVWRWARRRDRHLGGGWYTCRIHHVGYHRRFGCWECRVAVNRLTRVPWPVRRHLARRVARRAWDGWDGL